MKNWFYIPFLVLMAMTYTRLVENYNSEERFNAIYRGPAASASEEKIQEPCLDLPSSFNPHYSTGKCTINQVQ